MRKKSLKSRRLKRWVKVRKYWRIFPLPKKCAENYPGIINHVREHDKIFTVFNLLQFKKKPTVIKLDSKRKIILLMCNILKTFNKQNDG